MLVLLVFRLSPKGGSLKRILIGSSFQKIFNVLETKTTIDYINKEEKQQPWSREVAAT